MNFFYAKNINIGDKEYFFDKNESRHISRVLRKNIGDILFLTNGNGFLFKAEIKDNNVNCTVVEIIDNKFFRKREKRIHIAIAPTKSNERFEWFLEKATEIGVDEITPILTDYSERKKINLSRYERVIVSAMKQSLHYYKPRLNSLTKWNDFIGSVREEQKIIAYCKADNFISDILKKNKDTVLLIGPEGGFSEKEIIQAIDNNFIKAGLSKNRLRTETAGIVGLTAIYINGV